MKDTELKSQLLKLASDIKEIVTDLKKNAEDETLGRVKVAAPEDFSLGAVGGQKRSTDPLMDFIFS
jgi:hypothetical protein